VTARTGTLPTLHFGPSDLPFLRFLENVRLHYPGIELIADAEISADTDPYLKDHCFQGDQVSGRTGHGSDDTSGKRAGRDR
jgi:enediyne polyketide synthase